MANVFQPKQEWPTVLHAVCSRVMLHALPPQTSTPPENDLAAPTPGLASFADVGSTACPACDYPLHATIAAGGRSCPECGRPIRFVLAGQADAAAPALVLVIASAALTGASLLYLVYVVVRGVYFLLAPAEVLAMVIAAASSVTVLGLVVTRWGAIIRSRPSLIRKIAVTWVMAVVLYLAGWLLAFTV